MWYSEENVAAVMQVVTGFAANISVNQDLLDMIQYWDDDGVFASWGLFDGSIADGTLDMENLWKAIAYSWIWITNTEPEFTVDQYIEMLNNPGPWNEFYGAIRNMAMDVFGKQNNLEDATDLVNENWGMILQWGESFPKFFADNFNFESPEEFQSWIANLINLATNPAALDANEVLAAFNNFQNSDGIEGFTPIVNRYYQNFVENNPMPQKPNYIL